MGFAFIREGDTTSHGGRVLSCTPSNTMYGKPLALLGDKVSCPKCGGVYPIVSAKQLGMTFGGRPVASDGDKTACGAVLIATQSSATATPTGGTGGSIGSGKSVVSHANDGQQDGPHRGRFQVLDDITNQPIPNHPYTLTSSTGQTVQGTTDTNGYTSWLETHEASSLTFDHAGSTVGA
ncbi:PAAR domain-containing protein [Paraburkholderia bryophila]|uniref:Putative Zn-binding protein involved in type VI secretion n=1 Tax=Paraburkholderia bryophila TaxID=420952 RepID=A0A7Y9WKQ3_9BURK|nr:PAAR domain-containing protein [Paraburkholderia bryophila]NYH22095.1 putative Zn-binding protein involved in type VI secretion [Paraburkholderia bryophila]